MGFISIQTVCFVLWVDLYRAWTQLYMFWLGLLGIVGYQHCRVHYTTLGAVCHNNLACLGQLTSWVTLGQADMPVEVYFEQGIWVVVRSIVFGVLEHF